MNIWFVRKLRNKSLKARDPKSFSSFQLTKKFPFMSTQFVNKLLNQGDCREETWRAYKFPIFA